jgi:hypothetical protein
MTCGVDENAVTAREAEFSDGFRPGARSLSGFESGIVLSAAVAFPAGTGAGRGITSGS